MNELRILVAVLTILIIAIFFLAKSLMPVITMFS